MWRTFSWCLTLAWGWFWKSHLFFSRSFVALYFPSLWFQGGVCWRADGLAECKLLAVIMSGHLECFLSVCYLTEINPAFFPGASKPLSSRPSYLQCHGTQFRSRVESLWQSHWSQIQSHLKKAKVNWTQHWSRSAGFAASLVDSLEVFSYVPRLQIFLRFFFYPSSPLPLKAYTPGVFQGKFNPYVPDSCSLNSLTCCFPGADWCTRSLLTSFPEPCSTAFLWAGKSPFTWGK